MRARPLQLALLSGGLIGCAWLLPGSVACAALAWLACFALVATWRCNQRVYLHSYIAGLVTNLIGFYWLNYTIEIFGGFPKIAAIAVFIFFVCVSALQYPLAAYFMRNPIQILDRMGLSFATAWTLSELVSIRIFPWYFGHTQLAFVPLAQAADLGGALLISFLMFWCSDALVSTAFFRARLNRIIPPIFVLAALIFYGQTRIFEFSEIDGPTRQVVVVQPNLMLEEKMNPRNYARHERDLLAMSQSALAPEDLVIWPETALMRWLPADGGNASEDPIYPKLIGEQPLLMGALTTDNNHLHYNSALLINHDGQVPPAYHKRILMPFGEYMPFESFYPDLRKLNPMVGDFTAGERSIVFNLAAQAEGAELKISTLICYEDVVARLGREAVLSGATVLVNLTNDSWFGDTAAPFQHHLIASFRAIETKRYLVRSTNTGLSAIVDPLGRNAATLPVYQAGNLVGAVAPYTQITLYTRVGDTPFWLLLGVTVAMIVFKKFRRSIPAIRT